MFSKVNYAHSKILFCSWFQACLLHCISYHVFESILNRSDYQALLWNLLLSKEARGWASRWARCPRCTPQRCCPGECTLGRRGEVMIDGLLSQTCGSQQVGSAEDLHHLLKVQGDVMMQEVWSHDSSPGASVAVKQRPVVQHQIFRSVLYNDMKNRQKHWYWDKNNIQPKANLRTTGLLHITSFPKWDCVLCLHTFHRKLTDEDDEEETLMHRRLLHSAFPEWALPPSPRRPSALYLHKHYITQLIIHCIIGVRAVLPQTAPELQDISLARSTFHGHSRARKQLY